LKSELLKIPDQRLYFTNLTTTPEDDADGYLCVNKGDHILFRFEVKSVLGKGSFAQVVSAYDHVRKQ